MAPGTSIRCQPISLASPREQIDGGDHRAANAVKLLRRAPSRGALPWPQSQTFVTGSLPGLPPGLVDRMIGKHRLAGAHQFGQQAAARPAGIAVEDALIGQIVRRQRCGYRA